MNELTLKQYLISKGYRIKWVASQVGMNYHAFWHFLDKNASLNKEVARRIEIFTQGDWVAVKDDRFECRWRMEINI